MNNEFVESVIRHDMNTKIAVARFAMNSEVDAWTQIISQWNNNAQLYNWVTYSGTVDSYKKYQHQTLFRASEEEEEEAICLLLEFFWVFNVHGSYIYITQKYHTITDGFILNKNRKTVDLFNAYGWIRRYGFFFQKRKRKKTIDGSDLINLS